MKRIPIALTVMLMALTAPPAFAQDKWPERPVKLIVPYPPGGVSDFLGRHTGRLLEKELGQAVVVENRPGAGSNIGSDVVAKSAPDGYTILLASSANAVNMFLYKRLPYDTTRDLAPVSLLAEVPNVLVINASFPARTVADLISQARQKPGDLSYASAGSGSPAHLAAELFKRMADVQIRHIAYKGAGPAIADVMAGHVPMMFTNIAAVIPGLETGKLRLLGTGGTTRWPAFPDTPTIAEAGVPGYTASAWYGLMVPAGTPPSVVARIQLALQAVRSGESREAIRKQGAEPVISTPDVLKARLDDELKAYAKLIKESGISAD